MNDKQGQTLNGPQKAMAWVRVAVAVVGLLVTLGGLVGGIAYGKYEMDRNADLTKQLAASDKKQTDWENKWSASQDEVQKLRQQLLDVKQQDITCKSSGANSDQLQKAYEQCEASYGTLKKADNAGILQQIDHLNSELMSVDNEMFRIQGKNGDGSISPGDVQYLEDYKTEHASLEERIKDAQKRLICPG